jgi:hypothetical protein
MALARQRQADREASARWAVRCYQREFFGNRYAEGNYTKGERVQRGRRHGDRNRKHGVIACGAVSNDSPTILHVWLDPIRYH